jgi:hypothetical protein
MTTRRGSGDLRPGGCHLKPIPPGPQRPAQQSGGIKAIREARLDEGEVDIPGAGRTAVTEFSVHPSRAHLGSAVGKHKRPPAATIARTCVGFRHRQSPVSDRSYVQAIGIGQTEA